MPDAPPLKPSARLRLLTVAACVLFLAYAGCFLYFFVDDEAIPLVYAHNLLRGRGLVYTALEGRVEGYSDFLHVLWSTALLTVTRAFSWSRLAPLLAGKAVSLIAGAGVVVLTGRALQRTQVSTAAAAAALSFLCLAGPLAVWSASSLETVVFALTVLAFALAVWEERLTPAVLLGLLVVLERIDGPIYVAAILASTLAISIARWRFLVRAGSLLLVVAAAYHAWRWTYFGSLLSAPMATKVLHRFAGSSRLIAKAPDIPYLQGLIGVYGWTGAIVFAIAAAAAVRSGLGRMSLAVLLLLAVYVERVDDWMFGWRFVVAMLPFAAIVIAIAVDRLPRRAAVAAAAAICVWSGVAASRFVTAYHEVEGRPIFWLAPRAGEAAWLGRYEELLTAGRRLMHAGDRIAYNQAGLLPYVLELENVDDLGICSGFVARLPTTDVYYTGVGRYSPLTNAPVIRTAHAYLLYQDVQFLVTPMDLLRKANHSEVPAFLLDGAFERAEVLQENVIYRRTAKPIDRFARDPIAFTENVVHYSHVRRAAIDGQALPDAEIGPRLPFLRELPWAGALSGTFTVDVVFSDRDVDVTSLYLGGISSSAGGMLTIVLNDASGRVVYRAEVPVSRTESPLLHPLPPGTRAAGLSLAIRGGPGRITLADVRLQGQTAALAEYLHRHLRFPAR